MELYYFVCHIQINLSMHCPVGPYPGCIVECWVRRLRNQIPGRRYPVGRSGRWFHTCPLGGLLPQNQFRDIGLLSVMF